MKLENISPLTTNSSSALYLFHDKSILSKVSRSELNYFSIEEINSEEDFWNNILGKSNYEDVSYNFFSGSEKLMKDCFGNGEWYKKELRITDHTVLGKLFPNYDDVLTILSILETHFIESKPNEETVQALINTGIFVKNSVKTPFYLFGGWDWNLEENTEELLKEFCIDKQYTISIWSCSKADVTPKHPIVISEKELNHPNLELVAGPIYKNSNSEILAYLVRECNGWNRDIIEKFLPLDHFIKDSPDFSIRYGKLLPIHVAYGVSFFSYYVDPSVELTYIYRDISKDVS